jgi:hypothetical protein
MQILLEHLPPDVLDSRQGASDEEPARHRTNCFGGGIEYWGKPKPGKKSENQENVTMAVGEQPINQKSLTHVKFSKKG